LRRSVLALELAAGLVCLAVLPAISARGAEPQAGGVPSRIVQGQALFERRCARCHGMGGDGSEGVAPPLFNVVGHEVAGQPRIVQTRHRHSEELNVDPSRASRIAADLIAKDYLIREAAQDDGRKSIVVLTDKAKRVFSDFYDMKWSRYMEVFSEWDESEITTFSQLFNRYCSDFKRIGEKF